MAAVSASASRRATGGQYDVATRNASKLAVNEYLARLSVAVIRGTISTQDTCLGDDGLRTLLLETGALHTFRAFRDAFSGNCSCGHVLPSDAARCSVVRPEYTVIPNPSTDECAAMRRLEPDIVAVESTTHVLLPLLCRDLQRRRAGGGGSTLRTKSSTEEAVCGGAALNVEAFAADFLGGFDVVWLDYCGTLNSRAGRARRLDLRRLLRGHLLSAAGASGPSSGRIRSFVAVTLSTRGADQLYEGEIVDMLLLYFSAEARAASLNSEVISVVRYRSGGTWMWIVAWSVGGEEGESLLVGSAPDMDSTSDWEARGLEVWGWQGRSAWRCLEPRRLEARPGMLLCAQTRIGDMFAADVALGQPGSGCHVFVKDTRCLPVARALRRNLDNPQMVVACDDPLDHCVAVELGFEDCVLTSQHLDDGPTQTGSAPHRCRSEKLDGVPTADVTGRGTGPLLERLATHGARFAAVWLSYGGTLTLGESKLGDLEVVIGHGLVDCCGGVLGLQVGYSETQLPWEDFAVDYLVDVVRAAVGRCDAGLAVDLLWAATFVTTRAFVAVTFRIGGAGVAPSTITGLATGVHKMPSHWRVLRGADYDAQREKKPTPAATKFRVLLPWLRKTGMWPSVDTAGTGEAVLVCEPGGFHVVQALRRDIGKFQVDVLVHGVVASVTPPSSSALSVEEACRKLRAGRYELVLLLDPGMEVVVVRHLLEAVGCEARCVVVTESVKWQSLDFLRSEGEPLSLSCESIKYIAARVRFGPRVGPEMPL